MMFKNQIFRIKKNLGQFPMLIATHILGPIFWKMGIVFLTWYHGNTNRIGEMAHQFDMYVKMGILGWGPSSRGIILLKENVANPCFLNYWQRYFHVISNPLLVHLLYPFVSFIQYNSAFVKMPDGKVLNVNDAHNTVQKQWEDEGRQPLLTLSSSHLKKGWDCLEKLGVPSGAWFVCLHARESGFLNQMDDDPYVGQRNADVNTYLLAVKTIVESGGWVIRMGDPSTKSLPSMNHVIDYAHSEVRSDWMDIFCCAECRFFLGTTSGLFLVSFDFGVPCAEANYTPMGAKPRSGKDIFIPKPCLSTNEERYLTFKEALTPPLDLCADYDVFKSFNVKIVDNTPEEINDIVLEMLERLNGKLEYTEEDEHLQERYIKLLPHNNVIGGSRIGRAFLRKYARLLPDDNDVRDDFS